MSDNLDDSDGGPHPPSYWRERCELAEQRVEALRALHDALTKEDYDESCYQQKYVAAQKIGAL